MKTEEAKKIIREAITEIKGLMAQEKWKDAHRACMEVLRFDPENIRMIRLKNRIEKTVRKMNRESLKMDLKNLEPLWKEKKYEELLEYLRQLRPYAADLPKINSLYVKATKAYKGQLLNMQEDYLRDEVRRITAIGAEGKYGDAIKEADKLLSQQFDDARIRNVLKKLKTDYIEDELARNTGLTSSERYEDILIFYQSLLHIDGKSDKVKRLIDATKKKYQAFRVQQRRELIYKQLEKIRTLFQMGRYEQVIDLTEEIIDVDPQNKEARFFFLKASRKFDKAIENGILSQMRVSRAQLKAEMKKNRSGVTRI